MNSLLFTYGDIVTDILFTGRAKQLAELEAYIQHGQTCIIYGLRRVGKSSLIHEAIRRHLSRKSNKKDIAVFFDLSKVVNSKQFLVLLAKEISNVLDKTKPIEQNLKKVAGLLGSLRLSAKINSITGELEHSLDFAGSESGIPNSVTELTKLLNQIAVKHKLTVVFDEFQGITKWDDNDQIQWQIRSAIQVHKNISYIFSGSSHSLIERIFMRAKSALYRSGSIMHVDNFIDAEDLVPWIKARFKSADIYINPDALLQVIDTARLQPYYTQKLCNKIWIYTQTYKSGQKSIEVKIEDVFHCIKDIVTEENPVSRERLERLSYNQQNVLLAIAELSKNQSDVDLKAICSKTNIGKPSIQTALRSLERSEDQLIYRKANQYFIEDPFFKAWLQEG